MCHCKIKTKVLSFWVEELVDWWVFEFFLVPRKVRLLAMTMLEQARHCSFGLTGAFFPRSSKSAFTRHDNARASSTLFIWINGSILSHSSKSAFSHHDNVRTSSALFVRLSGNVLPSFLEKCVFSPWQCSNKLDIIRSAYRKRSNCMPVQEGATAKTKRNYP